MFEHLASIAPPQNYAQQQDKIDSRIPCIWNEAASTKKSIKNSSKFAVPLLFHFTCLYLRELFKLSDIKVAGIFQALFDLV